MRLAALLLALVLLPAAAPAGACGTPQGECPVPLGYYRLALPAGAAGPVPAVVYLHGYNGSSEGAMKNAAMLADLSARGYALIAPQGIPSAPERTQNAWGVRSGRSFPRDDLAFLAQVLGDAALHGVNRGRVLMAGFSLGGSMTWDVACHAPGMARAYAPVAGAFWEPMPPACDGPVDLFHTHGWTDRTVPLEGRSVGNGVATQGDVFASLRILRDADGCAPQMPDTTPMEAEGNLWLRHWGSCPGGEIALMLHPGGHMIPDGWTARALDWFEALPPGR